jgi:hypothetical protein
MKSSVLQFILLDLWVIKRGTKKLFMAERREWEDREDLGRVFGRIFSEFKGVTVYSA